MKQEIGQWESTFDDKSEPFSLSLNCPASTLSSLALLLLPAARCSFKHEEASKREKRERNVGMGRRENRGDKRREKQKERRGRNGGGKRKLRRGKEEEMEGGE